MPDANQAYFFGTGDGSLGIASKDSEWIAVAVRDGDVATAIPEPQALAMMLAGLCGVGFLVLRRKRL